jgi:hypothetical protein
MMQRLSAAGERYRYAANPRWDVVEKLFAGVQR